MTAMYPPISSSRYCWKYGATRSSVFTEQPVAASSPRNPVAASSPRNPVAASSLRRVALIRHCLREPLQCGCRAVDQRTICLVERRQRSVDGLLTRIAESGDPLLRQRGEPQADRSTVERIG